MYIRPYHFVAYYTIEINPVSRSKYGIWYSASVSVMISGVEIRKKILDAIKIIDFCLKK